MKKLRKKKEKFLRIKVPEFRLPDGFVEWARRKGIAERIISGEKDIAEALEEYRREKETSRWREDGKGVSIERPKEEIISLTRAGENQNLEYKYDVMSDEQKNHFIEYIIAFLNTNRGIILVGVHDDGNIVGNQKDAEHIQKLLQDVVTRLQKILGLKKKRSVGIK